MRTLEEVQKKIEEKKSILFPKNEQLRKMNRTIMNRTETDQLIQETNVLEAEIKQLEIEEFELMFG